MWIWDEPTLFAFFIRSVPEPALQQTWESDVSALERHGGVEGVLAKGGFGSFAIRGAL